MGYLSGVRFQAEVNETILSLREVRFDCSFLFLHLLLSRSSYTSCPGFKPN